MAAKRILANDHAHTLCQPIETAAHVGRLGGQPYPRCLGSIQRSQVQKTNHPSLSKTASNARKWRASNPGSTTRLVLSLDVPQSPYLLAIKISFPAPGFSSTDTKFALPIQPNASSIRRAAIHVYRAHDKIPPRSDRSASAQKPTMPLLQYFRSRRPHPYKISQTSPSGKMPSTNCSRPLPARLRIADKVHLLGFEQGSGSVRVRSACGFVAERTSGRPTTHFEANTPARPLP
jgi:hypothetical protein